MRWIILAGALGFMMVLVGCSRTQRHTLLTVFFEGVPPLDGKQTNGEPPSTSATAPPPRRDAESGGSPSSPPKPPEPPKRPKVTVTLHLPFKLRLCSACHPVSRGEGGGFARLDISAVGSLNKPVPALCYGCHADKAHIPETLAGGWMHGPVAAGACTLCHSPHSSRNSFLLLANPTGKLCQRCHEPGLMHLGEAPIPEEGQDCTACHYGHSGKTRFLLKPPPKEEPDLPASPPAPSGTPLPVEPPPAPAPGSGGTQLRSVLQEAFPGIGG